MDIRKFIEPYRIDHGGKFRLKDTSPKDTNGLKSKDRAEALLMQRSVRENIALPSRASIRKWGRINLGSERRTVSKAVETLQIDARAGNEVRRLSGGNQQKVTIARWVAGGVRTMLCFDPTRGIDIGTKAEVHRIVSGLAAEGMAILLISSDLPEILAMADRIVVMREGRVTGTFDREEADQETIMRAATGQVEHAA